VSCDAYYTKQIATCLSVLDSTEPYMTLRMVDVSLGAVEMTRNTLISTPISLILGSVLTALCAFCVAGQSAQSTVPQWLANATRFGAATGSVLVWYVQASSTETKDRYSGDSPSAEQRKELPDQGAPLDLEWPKRRGYPAKPSSEVMALWKATELAAGLASAEWAPSMCDNVFFEKFQRAALPSRPMVSPLHIDAATIQFTGGPDDLTYLTMRKWAARPCDLPEISASVSSL